ncbi:MAG: TfoXN domain-containing protein [Nitrospira sp.]|nr:MAG: TfoXN domain-containing protein [Nitrospira sp.]
MATRHDGFKDFVLDQLADLRGLTCQAMFGGYGLRHRGTFFGIVHKGRVYFKVTPETVTSYTEQRMKPLRVSSTMTLQAYYEVPTDVLEDAEQLALWAETACAAQPSRPTRMRTAATARRPRSVQKSRPRS